MITQEVTQAMVDDWKSIWLQYKDKLQPNRKSGIEVLDYLKKNYSLTELNDKNVIDDIVYNITMNMPYAEKLPKGITPNPRAFILEEQGEGKKFYETKNQDPIELWGTFTKIIVGVDIISGYYMVDGSTMLWDELCAYRGLDEKDLQNYVCVAEYINSLERFDMLKEY